MARRVCGECAKHLRGQATQGDGREHGTSCRTRAVGGTLDDGARNRKKSIGLALVTVEGKRTMIAQLKDTYPVERICAVLDCPRSSYYYMPSGRDETELVEAIEQMLLRKPFFGYRRISAQLKRGGRTLNTKAGRRILKELGLHRKVG